MHWLWLCLACFLAPRASAQGLAGFLSPGPLAEPHADVDGVTQCARCHEPGKGVTPDRCLSCHDSVKAQVDNRVGFHSDKREKCESCHPDHRGRAFDMVQLEERTFDHDATGFPLVGPHQREECSSCHRDPGVWSGLQQDCASCHEDVHGSDRPGMDRCERCHDVVDDWKVTSVPETVLDHTDPSQVDWILEGAHVGVGCTECHEQAVFRPTEHARCTDCHADPHRADLPGTCESCHTVRSFRVPGFDHELTGWSLEGRHASVGCRECHGEHATRPLPHDACADCHQDPHAGQFAPRTCDTCHDLATAGFRLPEFDHSRTDYPLRGQHATVACQDCHGQGPKARYVDLPAADCDACHEDAHQGRFEPTACSRCHGEEGWKVEDFDHSRTAFPLEGKHADVACEQCHPAERWSGVEHDTCAACHADDDPHRGEFPAEQCASCHRATGWKEITFDHAVTAFSLEPQHGSVGCLACHAVDDFRGLAADCEGCHRDDRPLGHYPGACESCHEAPSWVPATLGDLDHGVTGFPLEGAHRRVSCDGCHAPGAPRGEAQGTCVACHATDDVHRHGLGDACGDCHVPISWVRTRFDHFSTGWPLRGAHRLVACDACHAAGYVATPTSCGPCHAGEADLSVPAHRSSFFLDCEGCHQPYTWGAPRFAH